MKHVLHLLLAASLLGNVMLGWHLLSPVPAPTPPPTPAPTTASAPSLDWRSLEAPDFATYIANLRRAGCPEATIRHLIEPELHAVFEARRQKASSPASEPSSRADEAATLAALLNAPEAEMPATSHPATQATTALPSIPAAFLVGNASTDPALQNGGLSITPTDSSLAPETLQTLADMRSRFGDQVTSGGGDPSSREFYLQWLKAQRESDDYFASLYGGDHFISVQQQANLQRAQSGSTSGAQVTKSSN